MADYIPGDQRADLLLCIRAASQPGVKLLMEPTVSALPDIRTMVLVYEGGPDQPWDVKLFRARKDAAVEVEIYDVDDPECQMIQLDGTHLKPVAVGNKVCLEPLLDHPPDPELARRLLEAAAHQTARGQYMERHLRSRPLRERLLHMFWIRPIIWPEFSDDDLTACDMAALVERAGGGQTYR
jgi:hypothetical protein